ncbi:rootletin-like [Protopterus annectens]|uniref:rootletin-like n=1 Tax=Protopterus annectens TaxID=7888 RepID=UPI001CF9A026|nr:rootletin-like [Protopterus annectens]
MFILIKGQYVFEKRVFTSKAVEVVTFLEIVNSILLCSLKLDIDESEQKLLVAQDAQTSSQMKNEELQANLKELESLRVEEKQEVQELNRQASTDDDIAEARQAVAGIDQLQLDITDMDVIELLDSHGKELTSEDLNGNGAVEDLKAHVYRLQDSKEQHQRELLEVQNQARRLKESCDLLEKDLTHTQQALQNEREENGTLRQTKKELLATVKQLEHEIQSLKLDIDEREKKLLVAQDAQTFSQMKNEELQAILKELESQRVDEKQEVQELNRQVMILKGDISEKTSELLTLQRMADHQGWEHEQETLKLQRKIADIEAQRDHVQKEVEELKAEVSRLQDVKEQLKESCDLLEKNLTHSQKALQNESEKNWTLQQTKMELLDTVKHLEHEILSLKLDIEEGKQKLHVAQEAQTSSQMKNEELQAALKELESQRVKDKQELQELNRQV